MPPGSHGHWPPCTDQYLGPSWTPETWELRGFPEGPSQPGRRKVSKLPTENSGHKAREEERVELPSKPDHLRYGASLGSPCPPISTPLQAADGPRAEWRPRNCMQYVFTAGLPDSPEFHFEPL